MNLLDKIIAFYDSVEGGSGPFFILDEWWLPIPFIQKIAIIFAAFVFLLISYLVAKGDCK